MPVLSIDDAGDPRLADYQGIPEPELARARGVFVAEGRLVVRRLLASRFTTRSVMVTPAVLDTVRADLEGHPCLPVFVVPQGLMNSVAGFNMHRGCLALAERPREASLSTAMLQAVNRLLVIEGVNNPDNIGGLFRSAAAFGVDLVVLGPGCGDPLYRKAIRTSMAAALQVPFVYAGEWPGALTLLRSNGLRVVALTPAADAQSLADLPSDRRRIALLAGAEGDGLTADAMAAADERVRIPIAVHVDSLNVTVAVSIALFQLR